MIIRLLVITAASLLFASLKAQNADSLGAFTIDGIDTWKMHSSTIGEDYTVYVLKTDNYDTSKAQLPVLYMTDGDWNMTVAMNCFSMLRQDYTTHQPLVVGIGYGKNENKRFRDLNPATGGPKFLAFIEKEVMPFIDRTYRTNDERAIYGYSLGGMFTTYVLFNRPDLFQKIFIGAPGNNGYELMPAARKYFSEHTDLKSKVFIGVGGFEREVVRNIDSFTTYLKSKKCPDLILRSDIAPNAGHGAGLAQVMQDAIAFGYCEKHIAIKLDASVYSTYTGKYAYYENDKPLEEVTIYSKQGKLYMTWKRPNSMPEELLPFSRDSFFTPINERHSFNFRQEKGKTTLIISVAGDKDYRLVKQ